LQTLLSVTATSAQDVKAVVPAEKLSCFNLEDGFGWEQLCSALDRPIPPFEYPLKNTPARFDDLQSGFLDKAVQRAQLKALSLLVVPLASAATWFALTQRFTLPLRR
jgi:hypothetical protein